MWDVKLVDEDKAEAKAKSFTLTMWDVKVAQEKGSKTNDERFTLTMWDVKKAILVLNANS